MPVSRRRTVNDLLLSWYGVAKRDLPWRRTRDPYAIWVSEIMLQQTQVANVVPYFERWVAAFPNVDDLAHGDRDRALALWQGLGYYRRCHLLLSGAAFVSGNGWPEGVFGWRKVPGVGRYTAGAICSIAFGEACAAVDGNVERVFARLEGCAAPRPELTKKAWDWAERQLDREAPGDWNQAVMELGATICRPRNPECFRCPLSEHCKAHRAGRAHDLPVKGQPRTQVRLRETTWIPFFDGRFGVRRVEGGGRWDGLWEFPRVTSSSIAEQELREICGDGDVEAVGSVRHVVTHHRIDLSVSLIRCVQPAQSLRWLATEELEELAMPAPQRRAFELATRCLETPIPALAT